MYYYKLWSGCLLVGETLIGWRFFLGGEREERVIVESLGVIGEYYFGTLSLHPPPPSFVFPPLRIKIN